MNSKDKRTTRLFCLVKAQAKVITTTWVLVEFADALRRSGLAIVPLASSADFKPSRTSRSFHRLASSSNCARSLRAACRQGLVDDRLSLVPLDGRTGIGDALTADHHFEQAGFRASDASAERRDCTPVAEPERKRSASPTFPFSFRSGSLLGAENAAQDFEHFALVQRHLCTGLDEVLVAVRTAGLDFHARQELQDSGVVLHESFVIVLAQVRPTVQEKRRCEVQIFDGVSIGTGAAHPNPEPLALFRAVPADGKILHFFKHRRRELRPILFVFGKIRPPSFAVVENERDQAAINGVPGVGQARGGGAGLLSKKP